MRVKEYRFLSGLLDDDILADSRFKHRVFNSEELLKQKVASVFEENNSEYFLFSNNSIDKSDGHIVKYYDRKLVLYPINFLFNIVWWFFMCCYLKIITGAPLLYICFAFVIFFPIFVGPFRRKFFVKGESFSDGKATIPVKDIIALQILSSKKVSDYQLNLVLKDLTRRSVSCSKALYRTVSLAQVISNFLSIPIVTTEKQLLAIYQSKALGLVNTIARNNKITKE